MEMLFITMICVVVIDLSDFVESVKKGIWYLAYKGKRPYTDFPFRPFECSFCMTFWLCLIWLAITGNFFLHTVCASLLYAWFAPVLSNILVAARDILLKITDWK